MNKITWLKTGFLLCLVVTIIIGNAYSQKEKYKKPLTSSQFEAKFKKLRTALDRIEHFKSRNDTAGAIEEARIAVAVSEEEFGPSAMITVRPIFTLAELLGEKRLFREAEENFNKVTAIIDSPQNESKLYGISYRIRIAEYYFNWSMFDKAEAMLLQARALIEESKVKYLKDSRYHFDSNYLGRYTKTINEELEKIGAIKQLNQFNKKKK